MKISDKEHIAKTRYGNVKKHNPPKKAKAETYWVYGRDGILWGTVSARAEGEAMRIAERRGMKNPRSALNASDRKWAKKHRAELRKGQTPVTYYGGKLFY